MPSLRKSKFNWIAALASISAVRNSKQSCKIFILIELLNACPIRIRHPKWNLDIPFTKHGRPLLSFPSVSARHVSASVMDVLKRKRNFKHQTAWGTTMSPPLCLSPNVSRSLRSLLLPQLNYLLVLLELVITKKETKAETGNT